jgi:hypothetical protein
MTSIPMRNYERIDALKIFGYTEREAAFLNLAALQGGYFLRRHYTESIGKEIGGTAASLVEKLLSQKHATATTALNNTKIYHLSSRPFFASIGETDNRNRREHSHLLVKNRLIGLDFVLAHPRYQYLATEREKVDYFSGVLGIPLLDLPYKRYISPKTQSTTTRYFVDKYPIFLRETGSTESRPAVCFCYVDEGAVTLSGFETYLTQYSVLWRCLGTFSLIYIADTNRLFAAAERRFASYLGHIQGTGNIDNAQIARQMIEHFEARSLYEKGDLGSFSRDKLIRLRNEGAEFSTPEHQALYERYKTGGAQAVFNSIAPGVRITLSYNGTFSTYLTKHRYDFFGKYQQPR